MTFMSASNGCQYICSVRVCRHSDKQTCSLRRFGRLLSFLLSLNSPLSILSACWDWCLCFQKCLIIKQNKDILVMMIIEILIEAFLKSDVNRCQPAARYKVRFVRGYEVVCRCWNAAPKHWNTSFVMFISPSIRIYHF